MPFSGHSKARYEHENAEWVQEHVFTVPFFRYGVGDPHVLITTSSRKRVNVTLIIPGVGFEINKAISKDSSLCDIDLSSMNTNGKDIRMLKDVGKQNTTVIVRSSDMVNVHAISNDYEDGDGFVVIPTNLLGTTYYVASYRPAFKYDPVFVCITALHENTSVFIRTKRTQMTETLRQYESYRFDGDQYEDVSGSLVQSDKPIAVISGVHTKVPRSSSGFVDGLLVHVPPTNMWGRKFSIVPIQSINSGYLFRVQTLNISTTLNMSDDTIVDIRPEIQGQRSFYEAAITGDEVISFTSNQPVMVVQYTKSDSDGNPAMLIIPPITRFGQNVTFPVVQFEDGARYEYTHFITVIAKCRAIEEGFRLDKTVVDWYRKRPIDDEMCYASRNVSSGQHSITHTNPMVTFYVSVYGICQKCDSSYAYSAKAYYLQGKYILVIVPTYSYCYVSSSFKNTSLLCR